MRLESTLFTHNPDRSAYNYFSISVNFFPRMAPHFFGHHNSPSNLAKSRYPRLQMIVILRDLESPANCNALHHTATCRNVLQLTAKRCNTLRELESQAECNTHFSLQHTLQQTLSPQQTINPTHCCDTERSRVTCRLQYAF